ncbi:MAG: beta-N-acetylhexosaminidase [Pseudomonadota bacterium]
MGIGACILSVSGALLTQDERLFLSQANPWGVILMGRSCVDKTQVRRLISDIQDATGRQTLIFIDQEGGRVARLKSPEWPKFPPAAAYGILYEQNPTAAVNACQLGHTLLGAELADLGIYANCAPVADLRRDETHDSIGDRAFSTSPAAVVDLAKAALAGLKHAGVVGCLKHMPGQGRASHDSHYDLPRIDASEQELEQDFGIFAALADDALMGMTGHVGYTAIDADSPTTVSSKVISEIIRTRIGFDGLLMTDDLGMEALGGSLRERGERAVAAGCDILLHCSGFITDEAEILAQMDEIAEAAGSLTDKALQRASAIDETLAQAAPFDREAAWADYEALIEPIIGAQPTA